MEATARDCAKVAIGALETPVQGHPSIRVLNRELATKLLSIAIQETAEANLAAGFNALCNKVAGTLPPGWTLAIELERDSGGVTLTNPNGEDVDFPSNVESTHDEVNDALEHAIDLERTSAGIVDDPPVH